MQTTNATGPGDPDPCTTPDRHTRRRELTARDALVRSAPGSSPTGARPVSSHRACAAVLAPSAPFTSAYARVTGFDRARPDTSGGRMTVAFAQERHRRPRRLAGPLLSRGAAREPAQRVRAEAHGVPGQAFDGAVCDVAAATGPRVPAADGCDLGAPAEDRDRRIDLTNHAFGGGDEPDDGMTPRQARTEILVCLDEPVTARRKRPAEESVNTLVHDGGLDTDDALPDCGNVLIGGEETTRHAITGAVHALATVRPASWPGRGTGARTPTPSWRRWCAGSRPRCACSG
ncbi:hypothetical protein ACF1GW_38320 [Streptomyces achromogenes]|uniref:hypothetical protein n=1 Tax=Streptomyces achromogenes TaxID=67255 RepID=UPI0036FDBDAD